MSHKAKWGLRVNGIREGGALYRSWDDARDALLKRINAYGYEMRRQGQPELDEQRSRETLRIVSQPLRSPRENIQARIGSRLFQVTREPF